VDAYILIDTEVAQARPVAARVARLDGVLYTEIITGAHDVLARARRRCERDLMSCLEDEIRAIPGVTRTVVCPLPSTERFWRGGAEHVRVVRIPAPV
jgi:hypothetical protein